MKAEISAVGQRARRRIAIRLLPFLFLLYLICYVDRANVSFANLRMSVDLGFSDRVYGLGVGMFFVGYVLLEIPGAVIVERWSARKWLARIMITWGVATIFNGFVHTAQQFYVARFFVGVAEGSFFPGVIVYLTHWFRQTDRAKAIACFYAALPGSSVAGSLMATWLLGVQWKGVTGWRWIFVVEGIFPLILGIVTIFYLTDWPRQARWLSEDEREWISSELEREKLAKKKMHDYTVLQAFRDPRVLQLMTGWLFALAGALGMTYWLPTIIKRLSGLPTTKVSLLAALPGLVGIAAMLINGWHSDKTNERRWHTVIPLVIAGLAFAASPLAAHNFPLVMALFVFGGGIVFAYYPVFWSVPTLVLAESAAAACFGLINSVGQIGGFIGPYVVGSLNEKTGGLASGLVFIGACFLVASAILATVKVPAASAEASSFVKAPIVAGS